MNKTHQLAYLLLTLMAFFLACNHIVGRFVHTEIPPIGLSFWRWFFAAVILFPFIIRGKRTFHHIFVHNMGKLLLLGTLIVGATTLILVALNTSTAINISIINSSQPVLTIIFTRFFLKKKLAAIQLTGILLSCLGVLVMISKGQLNIIMSLQFNQGDLIALLAMCGFAGYAINIYRIPEELNVMESLFGIIISGCIILLPFYLLESVFYKPVPLSLTTLWAIPVLALLVSVFSMLFWNFGNRIVGTARATVFINLIPVFGIILATTLLGEQLFLSHIIGAVCIFFGVACAIKNKFVSELHK
jgi:drug/metabolite transporter (DMT)-like permease